MFAVSILDGEGNDDRRTARLCSTVTHTVLNALRMNGVKVPDKMYLNEEAYLSKLQRLPVEPQVQSWEQIKQNFGF